MFELNDKYVLENAKLEKKTTYVMLDEQWYNAVQFDFFDKDGNQVDILFDVNNTYYCQYRLKECVTNGV
jgi:hypothetical protein